MTVLQEPVQVKTHLQFVVTSGEPSIDEARAASSVPASATRPVRGVRALTPPQAPQLAATSTERVICVKNPIITVRCGLLGGRLVQDFNTMLVRLLTSAWLHFRSVMPDSL